MDIKGNVTRPFYRGSRRSAGGAEWYRTDQRRLYWFFWKNERGCDGAAASLTALLKIAHRRVRVGQR